MRTVEFEKVSYRTNEMIAASDELIANCAQYAGLDGVEEWPRVLISLRKIIKGQLRRSYTWPTPALNLTFSGFQLEHPQLNQGELRYVADPPYFVLEEGIAYDLLNRRRKSQIESTTRQIVEVVSDVHQLNIEWRNSGLVLEFPKDKYAQNIEVSQATII